MYYPYHNDPLTAVRMQLNSALAESAHALVDIRSPLADQHASMAANCFVHGLMTVAERTFNRKMPFPS